MKWLFGSLMLFHLYYSAPKTGHITLEINNIKEAKGYLWVGVYNNPQDFMNKEKAIMVKGEVVKKTGVHYIRLENMPLGTIAIALFHDLNGNGELDQTMIGIPKEPYAFSQKIKTKWRIPQYEDVKIEFKEAGQIVPMNLEQW
ncbi:MAG: DUF2141 domain-containing protein [Saprospiraceae bacterium]|nr:DUF2141 domain-containing protein [Saprospiraceae bacterium]